MCLSQAAFGARKARAFYLVDRFWVFGHIKNDCGGSSLHSTLGLVGGKKSRLEMLVPFPPCMTLEARTACEGRN